MIIYKKLQINTILSKDQMLSLKIEKNKAKIFSLSIQLIIALIFPISAIKQSKQKAKEKEKIRM